MKINRIFSIFSVLILATSCSSSFLNAEESKKLINEIISNTTSPNFVAPKEITYDSVIKKGDTTKERYNFRFSLEENYYYVSHEIINLNKEETWLYVEKDTIYKVIIDQALGEKSERIYTYDYNEYKSVFTDAHQECMNYLINYGEICKDFITTYSDIIDKTLKNDTSEGSIKVISTKIVPLKIKADINKENLVVKAEISYKDDLPTNISYYEKIRNVEKENFIIKVKYNSCNITKPNIEKTI